MAKLEARFDVSRSGGFDAVLRTLHDEILHGSISASYEDGSRFRLYANDTGLLMAMHDFDMKAAVVNNTLSGPMKGGLYENAVACMLAQNGVALRYWTSKDVKREIEFAAQADAAVVPVEVKASRGASLSLDEVLARDDVKLGYKLVDGNVGRSGKKVTLPLYLGMLLFRRRSARLTADGARIVRRHVIRDIVDEDLEPGRMRARHQRVELLHAPRRVIRQVRVDVVPVRDGIGRPGIALDEVLARRMARDAGIPDIVYPQGIQVLEGGGIPVREAAMAPDPGKCLIDDFLGHVRKDNPRRSGWPRRVP